MHKRMNRVGRMVALVAICASVVSVAAIAEVTNSAGGKFTQLATGDGLAITIYDNIDGKLVDAHVSYYDGESLVTGNSDKTSIVATDKTMIVGYSTAEIVMCLDEKTGGWEWCGGTTGTTSAASNDPTPTGCDIEVAIGAEHIVVVVQCGGRPINVYIYCSDPTAPTGWTECGHFSIPRP